MHRYDVRVVELLSEHLVLTFERQRLVTGLFFVVSDQLESKSATRLQTRGLTDDPEASSTQDFVKLVQGIQLDLIAYLLRLLRGRHPLVKNQVVERGDT